MVRRHESTAFMGGAYVFPGGRVDPSDNDGGDDWCDGTAHAVAQMRDLPRAEAIGYHVAAARELFEEAGVLLARDAGGDFIALAGANAHERFKAHRSAIHRGRSTLRAVVVGEQLRLALDALVIFAHWVTPPIDTRQFDTRFFMTRVPPHQTPAHDELETTHSGWLTPSEAIAQSLNGDIVLPPPTWSTLRELENFASVEEALRWASVRRIVRRQPEVIDRDGVRMLVVPGDPLHPEPDGGETLLETRFVLVGGRWLARQA